MESRLQGMVTKLKGLIASLGKQSLEQSTDHSRLGSSTTADTQGNNTKLEFPHFNEEGLDGWLLHCEYFLKWPKLLWKTELSQQQCIQKGGLFSGIKDV